MDGYLLILRNLSFPKLKPIPAFLWIPQFTSLYIYLTAGKCDSDQQLKWEILKRTNERSTFQLFRESQIQISNLTLPCKEDQYSFRLAVFVVWGNCSHSMKVGCTKLSVLRRGFRILVRGQNFREYEFFKEWNKKLRGKRAKNFCARRTSSPHSP